MLIVNVKDHGSIDRALKVLKRKFEAVGVVKELRERREFKKPCEKRRAQILDAMYRQSFKHND